MLIFGERAVCAGAAAAASGADGRVLGAAQRRRRGAAGKAREVFIFGERRQPGQPGGARAAGRMGSWHRSRLPLPPSPGLPAPRARRQTWAEARSMCPCSPSRTASSRCAGSQPCHADRFLPRCSCCRRACLPDPLAGSYAAPQVMATAGDTHLGGSDFDSRLVSHLAEVGGKGSREIQRCSCQSVSRRRLAAGSACPSPTLARLHRSPCPPLSLLFSLRTSSSAGRGWT